MNEVKIETWVRTGLLVLALVNQVLTMLGINPIPVSEEDAYTAFTAVLTTGATIWAWWKNNSFTGAAIEADTMLETIKNEQEVG